MIPYPFVVKMKDMLILILSVKQHVDDVASTSSPLHRSAYGADIVVAVAYCLVNTFVGYLRHTTAPLLIKQAHAVARHSST